MDLRVNLRFDGSGFQQGLTRAGSTVEHFSNRILGGLKAQLAAVFSLGALTAFSRATIEFASDMRDLSDRLGVNVEWLQKITLGAQNAGAKMKDLARFMEEVATSRGDALSGSKSGEKKEAAFSRLGIGREQLRSLPQEQFFELFAAKFNQRITAQMANDAVEVGGNAARKLIGAFADGIKSDAAKIIPEDLIDQLDDLADAFAALKRELMAEFAPTMVVVLNAIRYAVEEIKEAIGFVTEAASTSIGTLWGIISKGKLPSVKDLADAQMKGVLSGLTKAAESETAFDKAEKTADSARQRRRELRHMREKAPPDFAEGLEAEKDKVPKLRTPRSNADSLIAVGNFLGTSRGGIEAIGNETNKILREHTALLRQLLAKFSMDALSGIPL